ncbi:MAG TPA: hypothetical protein VEG26_07930 [Steroidobacteraceae bacterium]|nr:hypothetical protein [Steroidobacteraceae bacterium]
MRIACLEVAKSAALTAVVCSIPLWAGGAESAAPPADATSAVWTPKELTFVYQGFTSHYSCDGLLEKMRRVLLTLGARDDLEVVHYGCSSTYGTPDPFPGVRIKMNVLRPAPEGGAKPAEGAASAATVPAHWKKVEVRLNRDPVWEAGDCELIEQIKQKILPQFTTRNVEYSSNCVPHQLSAGGTWLRPEVLIADRKDDKALASK